MEMNHSSTRRNTSSESHRQQTGYRWEYWSSR